MDSRCIFYGIWSYSEALVDKITSGSFSKKNLKKERKEGLPFWQESGAGHPFLTGVENTESYRYRVIAHRRFFGSHPWWAQLTFDWVKLITRFFCKIP
jgi:hypothetical protein